MNLDDTAAERLLAFCGRLPAFPGDQRQVESNARFALECFAQRRSAIENEIHTGGQPGQDMAALRCELEALDAAHSVVTQLWQRRFGTALAAG
ncbi:hypothetical protein ACPOLB_24870 [Rubrivivax sp. RP6-9]|uniref:hypothetical protein n=1 Tax=Rubrivivax sp. RP6-9 TaxID=3415750 RepID=UPI003CC57FDF